MHRLNERAAELCRQAMVSADHLRIMAHTLPCGATVIDCGVAVAGGMAAGRVMAEICLAGLGEVRLVYDSSGPSVGPAVTVATDHPVAACMASQYAGWQISHDEFFAMGSGPKRAAAGKEDIFDVIGGREEVETAVGVLESAKLPPDSVCRKIAADCRVAPDKLILLVAPTASIAGTFQVVARTVETALHKMHELGFDIHQVQAGYGIAPLPPVAADDLAAIGRTNDAVLYGGRVTLWINSDDEQLQSLGPKVPSNSSRDHGRRFAEIFAAYDHDFYKIDPHLFSPAEVTLINLSSGRTFRYGRVEPDVLLESFK